VGKERNGNMDIPIGIGDDGHETPVKILHYESITNEELLHNSLVRQFGQ